MRHGMPESHATHPNVVPLIDIIMCLIIFFMLVAKIGVKTGEDEKIEIPMAKLVGQVKATGTLFINVKDVNGQPEVTAMIDQTSGVIEPFTLEGGSTGRQLKDALVRLRYGTDMKEGGAGPDADVENFSVNIRGDAAMRYSTLEKVLISCSVAHVKSINFQTTTLKKT